tara:strand:- start:18269 stop:20476 length:2208 start_codon:yes stop_codon:yes gene_type:complete
MKEWLTAREIAAERLPDMPDTERGVQVSAQRLGWNDHPYARPRQGRGGGMEYKYLILPSLAQTAYMQRHKVIGADAPAPEPAPELASAGLSQRARTERDARLAILTAYEDFLRGMRARGRAPATALNLFSTKYNARTLQVADWIRDVIPSVSPRSIMRWRSAKKKDSSKLAVDRSKGRKGSGLLETANGGAVRAFILGLIAHQPHLSAKQVRTLCRSEFGDQVKTASKGIETEVKMPPVRTFQHFIKGLKQDHQVELMRLTNPDRYRSTMLPSGTGTLKHITEPNGLWQIDASPVDALCTDGRHSVYVCVDIATRRFVSYISKTPRASAVALLIRKSILAWGVPETIKTDNGSDFTAREIERLFAALDIEMDLSDAYSPAQKGHVERAIKTYQHQFVALLPGYVGHSVSDRKSIEDRKSFADRLGQDTAEAFNVSLSGAELQALSDQWCLELYSHQPHSGLDGRSPFQAATASAHSLRMVDERALDVLLMPAVGGNGTRRITKFGVRVDGHHYREGWMDPGMDVFVRMDPNDKGLAHIFSIDRDEYLGAATCPELRGIHPETFEKARKQLSAELLKERVDPIKREISKLIKGPSLIERTLDVARRDVPNVVALPKRTEGHSTPEIAAALDAVQEPELARETRPLNERAAELHEAIKREHQFKAVSKVIPIDPDAMLSDTARMFKWALSMEAKITTGEALDDATAGKLTRFQATGAYQSMKDCLEDFGLENTLKMF